MLFASPALVGESRDEHPTAAVFCYGQGGAEARDYCTWLREVQRCAPGRRYLLLAKSWVRVGRLE